MSKIKWKINEASHQLRSGGSGAMAGAGGFWAASTAVCINSISYRYPSAPEGQKDTQFSGRECSPRIIIFILKRFPNTFNWAAWGIIASASGTLCKINNGSAIKRGRELEKHFPSQSGWLGCCFWLGGWSECLMLARFPFDR